MSTISNEKNHGKMFIPISKSGLTLSDVPQLSDFELHEKKADGAVADFYIASERKSGLKCGIKKIYKTKLHYIEKHRVSLLHNEIYIHNKQNNQYVVKLYGYFEDEEICYLILELGDKDLFYKLSSDKPFYPFHETIALRYIKMVALGLKSIHETNVIHKDLKLENFIYYEKEDLVKICDFGLSEYKDQQTFCNAGTLQYRPPELVKGKATEKSDIYSLGICLYVLTHGKYPKDSRFKFNIHLSYMFKNLILLMCNNDVSERIDLETFFVYPLVAGINI